MTLNVIIFITCDYYIDRYFDCNGHDFYWLGWLWCWFWQLWFRLNVIIIWTKILIVIDIILIAWDGCDVDCDGYYFKWLEWLWCWLLWFEVIVDVTDCDIDCDGYDFKWLWFCLCWWDLAVCEWTLIVLWAPHSLSTTRHVTSPTAVTFAVRTSSLERKVKKVILKSYPQRLEWEWNFLTDPLRACSPNQSPRDSVERNTGSSLADFCWVTLTCGPK